MPRKCSPQESALLAPYLLKAAALDVRHSLGAMLAGGTFDRPEANMKFAQNRTFFSVAGTLLSYIKRTDFIQSLSGVSFSRETDEQAMLLEGCLVVAADKTEKATVTGGIKQVKQRMLGELNQLLNVHCKSLLENADFIALRQSLMEALFDEIKDFASLKRFVIAHPAVSDRVDESILVGLGLRKRLLEYVQAQVNARRVAGVLKQQPASLQFMLSQFLPAALGEAFLESNPLTLVQEMHPAVEDCHYGGDTLRRDFPRQYYSAIAKGFAFNVGYYRKIKDFFACTAVPSRGVWECVAFADADVLGDALKRGKQFLPLLMSESPLPAEAHKRFAAYVRYVSVVDRKEGEESAADNHRVFRELVENAFELMKNASAEFALGRSRRDALYYENVFSAYRTTLEAEIKKMVAESLDKLDGVIDVTVFQLNCILLCGLLNSPAGWTKQFSDLFEEALKFIESGLCLSSVENSQLRHQSVMAHSYTENIRTQFYFRLFCCRHRQLAPGGTKEMARELPKAHHELRAGSALSLGDFSRFLRNQKRKVVHEEGGAAAVSAGAAAMATQDMTMPPGMASIAGAKALGLDVSHWIVWRCMVSNVLDVFSFNIAKCFKDAECLAVLRRFYYNPEKKLLLLQCLAEEAGGGRLLINAFDQGHRVFVMWLLHHGVNLSAVDKHGKNILAKMVGFKHGGVDVLRLIVRRMNSVEVEKSILAAVYRPSGYCSLVSYAIKRGCYDSAQLLLGKAPSLLREKRFVENVLQALRTVPDKGKAYADFSTVFLTKIMSDTDIHVDVKVKAIRSCIGVMLQDTPELNAYYKFIQNCLLGINTRLCAKDVSPMFEGIVATLVRKEMSDVQFREALVLLESVCVPGSIKHLCHQKCKLNYEGATGSLVHLAAENNCLTLLDLAYDNDISYSEKDSLGRLALTLTTDVICESALQGRARSQERRRKRRRSEGGSYSDLPLPPAAARARFFHAQARGVRDDGESKTEESLRHHK